MLFSYAQICPDVLCAWSFLGSYNPDNLDTNSATFFSSSPCYFSFLVLCKRPAVYTHPSALFYVHTYISTLKLTPVIASGMQRDSGTGRNPKKHTMAPKTPWTKKMLRSFRVVLTLKTFNYMPITEPRVRRCECVLWKRERSSRDLIRSTRSCRSYSVFGPPLAWRAAGANPFSVRCVGKPSEKVSGARVCTWRRRLSEPISMRSWAGCCRMLCRLWCRKWLQI